MEPSPATREFESRLARAAAAEVSVLVEGESGAGKGRAARALHAGSPRAAGPLVEVDLAALAPTLVEAELFGHEEGAFTGAHGARLGRFRRAHGGTLVLDDVDCLPEGLQPKLLRVLQERRVEPLGAEAAVPVDVRVIATSSAELLAEVEAGRFRQDLYYRLAVIVLRVPALRERRVELPELAAELAGRAAARAGVAPRPLSAEATDVLLAHPWPGNVRELENALERVHALGPRAEGRGAVPIAAAELDFLAEATAGAVERVAADVLAHGLELDAVSLAILRAALAGERGNVSAAARRLGLSRRAFEYRLEKLAPASEGTDAREGADEPDAPAGTSASDAAAD